MGSMLCSRSMWLEVRLAMPMFPSRNGNVTQTAPWLTNSGVQSRFKAAIWDPLHDLSSTQPATTQFIAKMKSMHPGLWFTMVPNLNKFNMAMEKPTITSISPAAGPWPAARWPQSPVQPSSPDKLKSSLWGQLQTRRYPD